MSTPVEGLGVASLTGQSAPAERIVRPSAREASGRSSPTGNRALEHP